MLMGLSPKIGMYEWLMYTGIDSSDIAIAS